MTVYKLHENRMINLLLMLIIYAGIYESYWSNSLNNNSHDERNSSQKGLNDK